MRTCYVDRDTRAIADLVDRGNGTMLLTRINVPREHRGSGVARALLARVLADADTEGVVIVLEICPSDGLSFDQLAAWYGRRGFVRRSLNRYRREPTTREVTI